ncbi:MAG: RNA polymerase sigma-70 factor [Bacteroidota bacterium]
MRDTTTDEVLLELIASHDEKALEALHWRYYKRLCDFAYCILNSIPITEEVVSDVFLQLWLKRSEITIRTKVKSYLFTAVRNQAFNTLKKEDQPWEDIETAHLPPTTQAPTTIENLEYREFEQEVDTLLRTLPEQRLLIFRLNRFEGLRYKEIAQILGISSNTVQNQMVAAVKQLASHYPNLVARWESSLSLLLLLLS